MSEVDDVPYSDEPIGPEAARSIQEGLRDVAEGRVFGPFNNLREMLERIEEEGT
jgi:hypothetical protein